MTELRKAQLKILNILNITDKILKKNNLTYFLLYGTALGAVRHKGFIPWDDDIDIGLYRKDFEKMEKILQDELPENFLYCKIGENKFPDAPIGYLYDVSNSEILLEKAPKIDIFPIDNIPDNVILQKIQKISAKIYHLCVYRKPAVNRGKKMYYFTKIILTLSPNFLLNFLQKLSKKIIIHWQYEKTKYIGNIVAGEENKDVRLRTIFNEGISIQFEGKSFLIPKQWDKYLSQVYGDYMKLPPKDLQKPHHRIFE